MPSPSTAQPEVDDDPLGGRTVLLDCRWLGRGGAGRVTELLLQELGQSPPRGRWRLWGDPARVSPYVFAGASIVPWRGHPTRWFGQADILHIPSNDVAVYLHQVRPLRPGRSITFVLDTIPLRFERRRVVRWTKRLFFRLACRLSTRIVTISNWSRDSIVRDLGVPTSRITVTNLSVDPSRMARIRALRAGSPRSDEVLFVGRFAPHKNLRRLCRAFQETAFHQTGGGLILAGGTREEVDALSAWIASEGIRGVEVRGECTEAELDVLMASCRALVQPSLEEGYGLPAVEAATVGIRVAVSRTGYATEIPPSLATFMDPLDERSIAAALDEAVRLQDAAGSWEPPRTIGADVLAAIAMALSTN